MRHITYRDGYKYQLAEPFEFQSSIIPPMAVANAYILLLADGRLSISQGYAWDGPSGPSLDTLDFMRGSLVHDALYQLMREGHLPPHLYREQADVLLRKMIREDGMNWIRASLVYWVVRRFGDPYADPSNERKPITAP